MDAMPEHWKEEADAQLTYLRNMHTCYLKVTEERWLWYIVIFVHISFTQCEVTVSIDDVAFPHEVSASHMETYSWSTFPFLQVFSRPEIRSIGIVAMSVYVLSVMVRRNNKKHQKRTQGRNHDPIWESMVWYA